MKFSDFINTSGYGVENPTAYKEAMKQFLLSNRLKPYMQAILRRGTDVFKEEITPLLNEYWMVLNQETKSLAISDSFHAGMLASPDHGDTEAEKAEVRRIKKDMYDSYLKFFRPQIAKTTASYDPRAIALEKRIYETIVLHGGKILDTELQLACHVAFELLKTEGRLLSFTEFAYASFGEGDFKSSLLELTMYQYMGFLSFIKAMVMPFAEQVLHTQNKHAAQKFLELFEALSRQLQAERARYLELIGSVAVAESGIAVAHEAYESIPPLSPPPGHEPSGHGCLATTASAHHDELRRMTDFHLEIQRLDELLHQHQLSCLNDYTDAAPGGGVFTDIKDAVAYWQSNFTRIWQRVADMNALSTFIRTPLYQGVQTIYRYVSKEEVDSILEKRGFSQAPGKAVTGGMAQSLEREKWFFREGARPGSGVTHAFMCEIRLRPGSFALFDSLLKNDGSFATVVKKEGEPSCLGIHEDALPFFNAMVVSVMMKSIRPDITFTPRMVTFTTPDLPLFLCDFELLRKALPTTVAAYSEVAASSAFVYAAASMATSPVTLFGTHDVAAEDSDLDEYIVEDESLTSSLSASC